MADGAANGRSGGGPPMADIPYAGVPRARASAEGENGRIMRFVVRRGGAGRQNPGSVGGPGAVVERPGPRPPARYVPAVNTPTHALLASRCWRAGGSARDA
jgi:hypothetical protein